MCNVYFLGLRVDILRYFLWVTLANCQAVKVSWKVNASQAQSLCETNSKATPDAQPRQLASLTDLNAKANLYDGWVKCEWCIVVIIFPYQSLCYLCLWTVHGPLSNPAINRKPWHGQTFFLYFMIIKKLLRSYLCIHWIYFWLYVVITVIALLILSKFF